MIFKNTKPLKLKVVSSEKVIYDGDVYAVSSINENGPFDVLNLHSNFITIIKDKLIIHKDRKHKIDIPLKRGVMHCSDNLLHIFIGV